MKIAMTGATGFVGAHAAARLVALGHDVRALTRGGKALPVGVAPVAGDLTSATPDALAAFADGADVLVHVAGELRDPERMQALHVDATSRLAAAASGRIGRWVQVSSTGVYGPVRSGVVREDAPLAPAGLYEATKSASDALVLRAAAEGAFETVVVRPSIVFGSDMPNESLRQMAAVVRRGLFAFVGPPGASANYVHVDDVAHALGACAERAEAAGAVYNLSGWTTMERFAVALAAGVGVPAPTRRLPEALARLAGRIGDVVPGFPLTTARVDALTTRCRYSTARIEADLGYAAHAPLDASVAAVAAAWAPR